MALAVLGLIVGSALLIACVIIVADRLARSRRLPVSGGNARGATVDTSWMPATYGTDGGSDCGGADGGAGCDGGGGD